MAYIELSKSKLRTNFKYLRDFFAGEGKEWSVVAKLLCGNELYLKEVLSLGVKEVCDARVSNLKQVKELDQTVETVYIKPPAKDHIEDIVRYADASFNTELETIRWLSDEAVRQNKLHRVIVMIELGDLREGIMGENLVEFYESIFNLPNILVTGLGANLNCLSGVYPTEDKLLVLCLYKQLIEAKFQRPIPWVTGGTSVVLPLLFRKQVPRGVNHFRIGETLFFGNDLWTDQPIEGMEPDVLRLTAQIIEITEKPKIPVGVAWADPLPEVVDHDYETTSFRAIVDLGVLDVAKPEFISPENKDIKLVAGSSDMLVLDLGNSPGNYKVGDEIKFNLKYMGALRLLNSDYIEKRLVD